MPRYQKLQLRARTQTYKALEGNVEREVEFKIRPKGIRGFFSWWPYWVGDRVRFRISYKNPKDVNTGILGTLEIYEELPTVGQQRSMVVSEPYLTMFTRQGEDLPIHIDIKSEPISVPGVGRYIVRSPNEYGFFPIVTFTAKPDETLTTWILYFFALIIPGAIGGVIGFLISRWSLGT